MWIPAQEKKGKSWRNTIPDLSLCAPTIFIISQFGNDFNLMDATL